MKQWWWISGPRWTFAIAEEDGTVVEAAPISKWAVGQPIGRVLRWWQRKGADRIQKLNEEGHLHRRPRRSPRR